MPCSDRIHHSATCRAVNLPAHASSSAFALSLILDSFADCIFFCHMLRSAQLTTAKHERRHAQREVALARSEIEELVSATHQCRIDLRLGERISRALNAAYDEKASEHRALIALHRERRADLEQTLRAMGVEVTQEKLQVRIGGGFFRARSFSECSVGAIHLRECVFALLVSFCFEIVSRKCCARALYAGECGRGSH